MVEFTEEWNSSQKVKAFICDLKIYIIILKFCNVVCLVKDQIKIDEM